MRILLIALILLFYAFFFARAFLLAKSLQKNIKAKNLLVNLSIISAGLSTVIFLAYLVFPSVGKYLCVLIVSDTLIMIGTIMVSFGFVLSIFASLSLKESWRIGVNEKEKTDLITSGLYRISRNPYFVSFDVVLLGMVLCLTSIFLIITVIATIILFHIMILKEEKYLEEKHKGVYKDYMKKVRRYV